MKKRVLMVLLATTLFVGSTVGVGATSLDERITALEQRVAELEAMVGITAATEATEEVVEEEAIEEVETVIKTTEEFINDIVESFNIRGSVSGKFTEAEINTMTYAEIVHYYLECAEAERVFYNEYVNAEFEDLNIQYLCNQYVGGLKKQYDSESIWEKTSDFNQFYDNYNSGYYNRAYVIVELSEYYDAPFSDVASMKSATESMDSLNEAEKRNASVPSATVKQVQQLLHDIGFKCWNIDGVAGKRTVKAIKRFQEMYGYEIDGMIDDELIQQLTDVKAEKES